MPTLNWIGKDKVINHHAEVPFRVLEHKYGFRGDNPNDTSETHSGNKIIHGDNLEVLKALLPEYEGKIDCIYIDPPYNTGNEGWVYNDNVNDPHIRTWLGKVVGSEVDDLTRHDKWICMMYPRLKLMHGLLATDGVIFISINDNEYENLKNICDMIWGRQNFVGMLTWESTTQPTNAGKARFNLQKKVEPILMYRKSASRSTYLLEELDSECKYPHIGKYGVCRFEIIEKSDAGGYNRETMKFPILGQLPREGKRWQIGEDTARELENAGKIEIVDGLVKKAVYPEDELDKRKFRPFWSHFDAKTYGTAESGKELLNKIMGKATGFDTIKPPQLISELISHLPKDSIVLDCFACSGTTAHSVLLQNKKDGGSRRFILVEMMDYAETITAERVRRVMNGYEYMGKIEEEIFSQKITTKTLLAGASLLEQAESIIEEKKGEYDKISKPKITNDCLKVIGIKEYKEWMEGLNGAFDYYELGEPLFMPDGNLNEEVGIDKIREYIYYTETHEQLIRKQTTDYPFLLDYFNGTGYFFYYKPNEITTLSHDTLNIVPRKADHYVIYADVCTISNEQLAQMNITFKKIPRDINRF